jgi:hypothetical protein
MQAELHISFGSIVLRALKWAAFGLAFALVLGISKGSWTFENTAGALRLNWTAICVIPVFSLVRRHFQSRKRGSFAADDILATMLTGASIAYACAVAVWLVAAGLWSFASGSTSWIDGSLALFDAGSINDVAQEIFGWYVFAIIMTLLFGGIEMWRFKYGHYHAPLPSEPLPEKE